MFHTEVIYKKLKIQNGEITPSFVHYDLRCALNDKIEPNKMYYGMCGDFGDLFRKSLKKKNVRRKRYGNGINQRPSPHTCGKSLVKSVS